jgi:hypothetical protein
MAPPPRPRAVGEPGAIHGLITVVAIIVVAVVGCTVRPPPQARLGRWL